MLLGIFIYLSILILLGGGPGAVVKDASLEGRRSRVRPSLWHSSFKETKQCLFPELVKIQYCVEPLWPKGSEPGPRPPGFESCV